MTERTISGLDDLRGFRGAPPLTPDQRQRLREELRQRVAACDWCTIGVMAASSGEAWAALRAYEGGLAWEPLAAAAEDNASGPVFLKGHQRNNTVVVREEAGLGEGVLISGHSDSNADAQDTWGPLPLDLFAPLAEPNGGDGATGL